ncbi:MAG: helix-turn-helix domain-containing protein [Candidatus Wallbacteria bacterium]
MRTVKRRSMCPISSTLDILGDKWSLLIIRDLMFIGKKTYGEFLKSEESIATNILAERLSFLEREQIIEKTEFPDNKVKNLYRLTSKGLDLLPILLDMIVWGDKYFKTPAKIKKIAENIRNSRKEIMDKILKKFDS